MTCVLCRFCGSRVAFMEDYISINEIKHGIKFILRTLPGGIFKRVFNVLLLDKVNYNGIIKVQSLFGTTVANANCGQCRTNLGWKFVAGTQQNMFVMEGIFLMKLDKLRLCNVENADQDGDANEQAPNDQDGDANEQDLGANEEKGHQGGDANEAVPKIELMEMLMNRLLMIKMEMLMNRQAPNDEDGDVNEQDLGANEENGHQDGDANEAVSKTEVMEMKIELFKMEIELINMERQLIKMGTLLFKMETTDQGGDATDDQDEDITDEDGDITDEDEDITDDQDEDITDEDGETTDED